MNTYRPTPKDLYNYANAFEHIANKLREIANVAKAKHITTTSVMLAPDSTAYDIASLRDVKRRAKSIAGSYGIDE